MSDIRLVPIRVSLAALLTAAAVAPACPAADASGLPSSARSVATPASPGSGEPSLAVAPDGEVWLSWFEKRRSGGHALRAARLEGARWGRPATVAEGDSFFVNWADFPTLLAHGGGRLTAHWPWKSGADVYAYDVRTSTSDDGGRTWSAPVVPHRDGTATEHGFVSMLAEADGARLLWLDGREFAKKPGGGDHDGHGGGEMTLRSAVVGRDGSIVDEALLDPRVCDCCQTAMVRTASGVLVAYRDRSPGELRDIWAVRLEDGRWSEPYAVAADGWEIAACPVNGPSLDAAGDRVAMAWYTEADEEPRVHVAFSGDGGRTFGTPLRVDQGDPVGRADIVLLEDGSAVVLWLEGSGALARIAARRAHANGALSPVATITRTSSRRSSGFPRVVRSGDRLILAWTEVGKPPRVRTAVMDLGGKR